MLRACAEFRVSGWGWRLSAKSCGFGLRLGLRLKVHEGIVSKPSTFDKMQLSR